MQGSSEAALAGDRQLLPLAAGLALGYQGLLWALDYWVFAWPPLPLGYYALNGAVALGVLGLALHPATRTDRRVVPLILSLMTLVPIVSAYLLVPPTLAAARPLGQLPGVAGLLMRLLPVLLLALVLTAWYYAWPQVLGFTLGSAALQLARPLGPADPALAPPPLFPLVVLGEFFSFLIIGYFLSTLVRRLRAQQAALDAANRQLRAHASTLESLTISRERNRMARELHDTLAHTLSGLSVQLAAIEASWEPDPAGARQRVGQAARTVRAGLQETRHALTALRASPLEDLGLALALRQLAETTAARAQLMLDWQEPDPFPRLAPDQEQHLYRVAQEALTNVVTHAQAQRLTVTLAYQPPTTALLIRDDGVGFDPAAPGPAGHYGLAGMQERAHLLGGSLTIHSRPGRGTTVVLHLAEDGGPR